MIHKQSFILPFEGEQSDMDHINMLFMCKIISLVLARK